MKAAPTIDGRLQIIIEEDQDWLALDLIIHDSVTGNREDLCEHLSSELKERQDWEDYIRPDLETHFSSQIKQLKKFLDESRDQKTFYIDRQGAEYWYGALNQSRLSLETKYQTSHIESLDEINELELEMRSAFLRSQFYSNLQGLLLEYIMA